MTKEKASPAFHLNLTDVVSWGKNALVALAAVGASWLQMEYIPDLRQGTRVGIGLSFGSFLALSLLRKFVESNKK